MTRPLPSSIFIGFLLVVLGLCSCGAFPLLGPHSGSSRDHKHKPPDRKWLSWTMTDGDAYVVFEPKADRFWLRRCVVGQTQATCEIGVATEGRVETAAAATHPKNRTTDAVHSQLAAEIAAALPGRKPAFLQRRGTGNTGEVSVRNGPGSVRYTLQDQTLELRFVDSSHPESEMRLALILYGPEAQVLSSYMSFSHLGLLALRVAHTTEGEQATSWLIYRMADDAQSGHGWVVPSLRGHTPRIITEVPIHDPQPPKAPPPDPPQAITPAVPAEPVEAPSIRLCETVDECNPEEICATPEAYSYNACGAPQPTDCEEGWEGDRCGHCYKLCWEDSDCGQEQTCNGHTCISPARCLPAPARWQ